MSTLHIVSSSPFVSDALERALSLALKDDAILLIENGVYATSQAAAHLRKLSDTQAGVRLFVLQEDLAARAVFSPLPDYQTVSYTGFVELVCAHTNSVNWS